MSRYLCEFEVFGRVQGVLFRKYTKQQADSLHLTGWCMNTRDDTVKGEIEGPEDKINVMKQWLEKTGSPSSNITKAVFSSLKTVESPVYQNFVIRR
ncbi:acylphosphatase-2-like [Contarinia nasturtii]|uniref:acylphosphatase-2-like n=1 Tax=Contarinia nasturtii TaxID=265458 RepID=UPI0012D38AE2|nr:acylphosphatase-2-like [Contarinia nasturtii]